MAGFRCPNCSASQTVEALERAAGRVVCRSCGAATSLEVSDPFGLDAGAIDLPAPKSAYADLPVPRRPQPPPMPSVGEPLSIGEDLPAPVFRGKAQPIESVPVRQKLPPKLPAKPPAMPMPSPSPNELPDLLAPVVRRPAAPPPLPKLPDNLPAPRQPSNLPAPKGFFDDVAPRTGLGAADLPAPKGFFEDGVSPQRQHKGPPGQGHGVTDLPAPKGFFDDGVAPQRPGHGRAGQGATDLPAPKGYFDDAIAPRRGPAGPADLPAPKGFFDDGVSPKTATGVGASIGPGNLPAPKGIFDDLSAPQPMGGAFDLGEPLDLGAPQGAAPLDLGNPGGNAFGQPLDFGGGMDLDQLTLGGRSGTPSAPPLDLSQRPFGLDELELEVPAGQNTGDFSGLALPQENLEEQPPMAPPSADGVVSFSTPSDSALAAGQQSFVRRRPVEDGPLELDQSPLPAENQAAARKTIAGARRAGVSSAPPTRRSRRLFAIAGVFVVLALAAGGFYAFTRWSEAKSKSDAVTANLTEARAHLVADRAGHWAEAVSSAKRARAADSGSIEAMAIEAQAHFAAAIDTGVDAAAETAQGKKLTAELRQRAAKGAEMSKAEGLQALVERRFADAIGQFQAARKANPRDNSLDLYLGWAQLESGDNAAAEVSFGSALKASPGRVAAHYGLARAQQAKGKLEEARASFLAAIEQSRDRYKSDHVASLVGAAELATVERFTDREARYLEILARGDLEKADPRAISRAWTLAGNEALRAGRLQEANQRFAKALELDGGNRAAVVGEGNALLALKRYDEARERLTRVLGVDANDLEANLALAEVALGQEQLTESKLLVAKILEREPPVEDKFLLSGAHRVLAGALALEPDSAAKAESEFREAIKYATEHDIRAILSLADFYVARNRGDEAKAVLDPVRARAKIDPAIGVSLGVAYMGVGDPVRAEETLRAALELRPGDAEARFQLGQALLAQKRSDEGLAAIKAAYEANRDREDIGLALAVAYEERERNADAAALYDALLAAEKPSLNVKGRAGRYFARRGAGARAIALGEEILAESRNHPAGLFLLGEKQFAAGEFDEAVRAYLDAAALDKQAQFFEGAGRAAEKQRGFDDALRHYEEALKLSPNYSSALLGQARIFMGRRAFSEAIAVLDRAIAIDSRDAWAHYARGASLVELSKLKDGVAALSKAVSIDDDLVDAYYVLGRALYDLDKAKPAASALAKATAKAAGEEPWLTEAYRLLGYAYRAARNRSGAISAFQAYLDRNPEPGPQRSDAYREMTFLRGGGR